jgi:2-polyprenyl-6-methoxyphenol hydroxylase-like FAD-dependent oxidoreductase
MARVVVIGGSVAGLSVALALNRRGHDVTVLEADAEPAPASRAERWEAWRRPGVPQFRHLHAALARGRTVLRQRAPDVLRRLLADGVEEHDVAQHVPGGAREPGDEELVLLRFRRPIFEGALRRVVEREPRVRLRLGVAVEGLLAADDHPSGVPRVVGVRTRAGEALPADLVVAAAGRRAPVPRWLTQAGAAPPAEEGEAAGMVYYGRYYRLRPGAEAPAGQRPPVRGDLGYLGYVLGLADDRTFVLTWLAPAWDRDLRALREAPAFEAAARRVATLAPWLEPARAAPIHRVEAMGQLRNTLRRVVVGGRPVALGLHVIGDALCHTNPALGWGISLALTQAYALADAVERHPADRYAQALALDARAWEEAQTCYRLSAEIDRSRTREWRGEASGPPTEDDWPRFMRLVLLPASLRDPVVFRAVRRALLLLDAPSALRHNDAVIARAKALAAATAPEAAPPARTPTRDELLAAMRAAARPVVA